MTVQFKDLLLADSIRTLTLEDVFRIYGEYSGIHRFKFDSLVDTSTFPAGEWTPENGTWVLNSGISGTGSVNDYDVCWYDVPIPASFVAEIEMLDGSLEQYIAFRGGAGGNYYLLAVQQTSLAFYKVSGHTPTLLNSCPAYTTILTGPGTIRLAVRDTYFSSNEEDRWLAMSVWVNDRLYLVAADNISSQVPGYQIGVAAPNGVTTGIDAIRIPDLCDVIPDATLDPGESPLTAIQRAIADRMVNYFVRYDNALRAWRPKAQTRKHSFSDTGIIEHSLETDLREYVTHIRLFYGLTWIDVFESNLMPYYGYHFKELYSSSIETEAEALVEAQNILRRSMEDILHARLKTHEYNPFVEIEDRVQATESFEYVVENINVEYSGGQFVVTIEARMYGYS